MMHKRILALVVVLCVIFNIGVSAKDFKQLYPYVESTSSETQSYDEAIEVLTSLELINRVDDKAYNPSETMTRSEFVNILVRMLELNDLITLKDQIIPFSDVNDSTSYVSSIIYAYKLGIISGGSDGTFNPDQPIKLEEALKMLIKILGYDMRAERKGGYPAGYLLLAKEKEITENVDAAIGQELNKGIVAQLILNTLDVNVMQISSLTETDEEYVEIDGETLLSESLRVEKNEGIVRATEITRLTGPSSLEYGQVEIGKKLYKTGKTNVWDLLGYNVTYYAREINGVPELLFAARNSKNTVLTVNSDDIAGDATEFSKRKFVYKDENDKKRTVSISPYAYVIYNGKALTDYTKADINPSAGEVTLIDNDRNDTVDVILVMEYQNLVVGDMSVSSKIVYDKEDSGKYIGFDPESEDYDFCLTKSGENISFKNIKKGNIVSFAVSKNTTGRKFVYAKVSDSSLHGYVTGKFTDDSDYYFTIDEKDYKLANNFSSEFGKLKMNEKGTFYFDVYGKLAAFEKDVLDSEMYGFLLSYRCGREGLKNVNFFEIYTLNGEIDNIDTAEKFYLDGKLIKLKDLAPSGAPSNPNEVEEVLMANVDETINVCDTSNGGDSSVDPDSYEAFTYYNQVIRYRLNYEGKIDRIDTIKPDGDDESLSKDFLRDGGGTSSRYYLKGQGSFGDTKVDFLIDENTLAIAVPDISKRENADNFMVARAQDYFISGTRYKVEAYDVSDSKISKLLVEYGNATDYAINQETSITLVEKVKMTRNEDDEFVGKLYGINNGKKVEVLAKDNTILNGLKTGDIVRYSVNAKGYINEVKKYVTKSTVPQLFAEGSASTLYYARFKMAYGMLSEKAGDTIVIDVSNTSTPDEHMYQIKSSRIWIYDEETGEVTQGTAADLNDAVYSVNPSTRVAVYTRAGDMKDIVIMKWL